MTNTSSDIGPIDVPRHEEDDLTIIKGIGTTREKWLKESLNVYTVQDLASLTAKEIELKLKAEGQPASRREIESWVLQARELADVTDLVEAAEVREPPVEVEDKPKANSPAKGAEWQPFASFVVEFQARELDDQAEEHRTTVHYMEVDESYSWPGIEGQQLYRWILDQLGDRPRAEPKEELPIEEPPTAEAPVTTQVLDSTPVKMTVPQLRAFQPPYTEKPTATGGPGQPFHGYIEGHKTFALEAVFELVGQAATEATKKHDTYYVEFYAHNLATGANIHLGNSEPDMLIEDQLSYTALLPEASLPPGRHRLLAIATVQAAPPILGYLEVPVLQVAQA